MKRMSSTHVSTEEIAQLNRQWMESYVRGDIGFLERHLAPDYVSTFPDGSVFDKQGEIDLLRSGAVAMTQMTPSEMTVRLYGETAVITGQSAIKARVKGQEVSGDYRFIDIWVRRNSHWQAVASQVTQIARP